MIKSKIEMSNIKAKTLEKEKEKEKARRKFYLSNSLVQIS